MSEKEPIIAMSLQNRFDNERAQAVAASRLNKPLAAVRGENQALDDYAAECDAIPNEALLNVDWDALVTSDFKLRWPQDTRCCIAMLPFDYGGKNKDEQMTEGKWDAFLASKKFLRLFSVSYINALTLGYGDMAEPPGRYFAYMPAEIQKDISQGGCTFDVEYSDPRNLTSSKDREWFMRQCRIAYSNLLTLLGKGIKAAGKRPDSKDPN